MLIDIKYPSQPTTSFKSKPQLLFVCQAQGEADAIPRVMHSHSDRLEIMFIYEGTGNYIIGGEFYSVKKGDILIFNASNIHDEQPLPSHDLMIYSCGITHLKLNDLPLNYLIAKTQQPVANAGIYTEQIKQIFDSLILHATQTQAIHAEIIHYITLNLLLTVCHLFDKRQQHLSDKKITLGQRIKEFLDKYYLEQIDIASISYALNVNRYYLSHSFKAFSGYSPKQYIIRRRLGEAQSLLLNTDDSVAKIASKVGYSNVNNFHDIFEKVIGMSPGKYKKLWLNKLSS